MKNIPKVFLITVLFLGFIDAEAQNKTIEVGVKAGVNLSNLVAKNKPDSKVGYQAGVLLDFNLDEWMFFRTGIEVVTKGAKQDMFNLFEGVILNTSADYSTTYIQVPIHAGYKMYISRVLNVSIHTGPYFAYGVAGKIKGRAIAEDNTIEASEKEYDFFGNAGIAKKVDFGLGFGLGFELNSIVFDLGADLGLANIADRGKKMEMLGRNIEIPSDAKLRTANVYLTVAYKF